MLAFERENKKDGNKDQKVLANTVFSGSNTKAMLYGGGGDMGGGGARVASTVSCVCGGAEGDTWMHWRCTTTMRVCGGSHRAA